MRRTIHAPLLSFLVVLLACPIAAWAEEPAAGPSPAEAFAKKTAGLPAPSAEAGFRFEGVLRFRDASIGHGVFTAAPNAAGQWEVKDEIFIHLSATPQIERATARLSRTLGLLGGAVENSKPGSPAITWEPTAKGFRVSATSTEGAVQTEQVRNVEHKGPALTTMSAMLLFCKMALDKPADYETAILEVENAVTEKGESIEVVKISILGEEELQGQTVLAVRAQKGEQEVKILFHAATRDIVAIRMTEGEKVTEVLAGDRWSRQARDGKAAALRAGFAFATGNVGLLHDVIHWPSFYAGYVAKQEAQEKEPQPLEAFHKGMLKGWSAQLPKNNPPKLIAQVLESLEGNLKGDVQSNGHVNFVFPPMFQSLNLLVAEFDGIWKLVGVRTPEKPAKPEAPKPAAPKKAAKPEAPKKSDD